MNINISGAIKKIFNNVIKTSIGTGYRTNYLSGGVLINPVSASKASAYYRGVTYISTQIAKLPLYIKDLDNNIQYNDIHYLLNVRPNPETNAFKFKNFLIQCSINWGNGFAEIERDIYGRPKNLWHIEPWRVTPMRTPRGELVYQVSGNENNSIIYLPARDILVVPNIYSEDGIHGIPTVAHAEKALGIALGSETFANGLYSNGGLPSGVLSHPSTLSDDAYQRLKKSWDDQMSGKKTGGTVILEEGTKYEAITHSPQVLQFIETRKFSVVEIARFLGVPPIKLFDMDSAKYGNMEQVHLEVATDILDVWARNIESEVDVKLLSNQRNYKSEVDLYAVFRGDMSTRSTYFQKMMQTASMTPNEIRKREGMAPYKDGDRFFVASNNFTPMDRIDEVIDSQVKPKEVETDKSQGQESDTDNISNEELNALIDSLLSKHSIKE